MPYRSSDLLTTIQLSLSSILNVMSQIHVMPTSSNDVTNWFSSRGLLFLRCLASFLCTCSGFGNFANGQTICACKQAASASKGDRSAEARIEARYGFVVGPFVLRPGIVSSCDNLPFSGTSASCNIPSGQALELWAVCNIPSGQALRLWSTDLISGDPIAHVQ